jgi:hypothetical protein
VILIAAGVSSILNLTALFFIDTPFSFHVPAKETRVVSCPGS